MTPIEASVEEWRKGYGSRDREAVTRLRRVLRDPLETHVKDTKVVLISPDGSMGRFPFAVLPGKAPGTILVEEQSIAVVAVPQLLLEVVGPATTAENKDEALLLVGDVDYGAEPGKPGKTAGSSRTIRVRMPWATGRTSSARAELETIRSSFRPVSTQAG